MKDFKKNTLSGISWSAGSQVFRLFLNIGITAVLARLLLPEDYGLLGMITVATGFLSILKDFGFGAALVQKKNVLDIEYHSVFWLNITLGTLLGIIVFFSAPLIADFYNEPELIPITKVMSIGFLINSFVIVPNNILLKRIKFKHLFIVEFISVIISGSIAIVLAFNNFSYWSLVAQSLTAQFISLCLIYYFTGWKPAFRFSREALNGLSSFSFPLIADKSFNYWVRNLDNLLIGKFLGSIQLGYYSKAYNLMLLPVRQISGTITKVLFPSFSLIQDDVERVRSVYLKISAVIAMVTFPLMALLFSTSDHVILFVFGENWEASIPIFQILCILGAFQSIATLSGNIYLSQGKTKLMFFVGLGTKTVMIGSMVLGLFLGGLMGLVYGYTISSSLMVFAEWYFVGKIINLGLISILDNLIPYFIFSGILILVMYFLSDYIEFSSHLGNLLFHGGLGLGLYFLLCTLFKPMAYQELILLYSERK